jgi:uncharacterized protein YecE (DUF72 family)
MARAYIGTSGWVYRSWGSHFYRGKPARAWLAHASRVFDSLEINGSFYRQVTPETFGRWRDETPPDFRFSLKGHRFITHHKRLRDAAASIVRLRDPARALGDKLAVALWQLPAHLRADVARLDAFLADLRLWPEVRHSIELRHRSWFTDEVAERLAAARVAVCLGDAPDFPMWRAITTDFVYVRLHGHTRKYASSYSAASLRRWAADVGDWLERGLDSYLYFDNDAEGAAIRNALRLHELLGAQGANGGASSLQALTQADSAASRNSR